jgi:hypothetical protein
METCANCGIQLKRVTPNHLWACLRVQLPQPLAQQFLDEPTATTKSLARRYAVHTDFLRQRLEIGGIPIAVQAYRGHIIRRMKWGELCNEQAQIPHGMKQCPTCELLIPDEDETCIWCRLTKLGIRIRQ